MQQSATQHRSQPVQYRCSPRRCTQPVTAGTRVQPHCLLVVLLGAQLGDGAAAQREVHLQGGRQRAVEWWVHTGGHTLMFRQAAAVHGTQLLVRNLHRKVWCHATVVEVVQPALALPLRPSSSAQRSAPRS